MRRPPLAHLEDTDVSRYSLQLNLYALLLRQRYGLHVSAMFLAAFAPAAQQQQGQAQGQGQGQGQGALLLAAAQQPCPHRPRRQR